jgi:hypothetical protein
MSTHWHKTLSVVVTTVDRKNRKQKNTFDCNFDPEKKQIEVTVTPILPEPPPAPRVSNKPERLGNVTCSSFSSHAEAQAYYEAYGGRLDRDGDGDACESLR